MGAFAGGVGRGIAEGLEKVGTRAYEALDKVGSHGGGDKYTATDFLASMRRSFQIDPRGSVVESMIDQGIKKRNSVLTSELAPVHSFQKEVHANPKLAMLHDYSK